MISQVCLVVLVAGASASPGAEPERDAAIALAKKTLLQRLASEDAEAEVEEATPVTWPDAGLGCPQKGMMYAQVLVPGYEIRLRVGERSYTVHVGSGRAVMCDAAAPPGSAGAPKGGGFLSSAAGLAVDFTGVRRFPIPIVMFMGRHDYTTPSAPTAAWLDRLEAPSKQGVWFERSAHMIPWEEPGKTLVSLLQHVRPLAEDDDED